MRIYADQCCFSRAYDFLNERKAWDQAEAFAHILGFVEESPSLGTNTYGQKSLWGIIYSDALRSELHDCPYSSQRQWTEYQMNKYIIDHARTNDAVADRWRALQRMGRRINSRQVSRVAPKDAWHLALAEVASADVFLTTDDQFYKWCRAMENHISIAVRYPEEFLHELRLNYGINTFVVGPERLRNLPRP